MDEECCVIDDVVGVITDMMTDRDVRRSKTCNENKWVEVRTGDGVG